MCAIDASSTASSVLPMYSPWSAPAYGGAVQHARHAHVVHEHEFASKLGRNVDTRLPRADHAVVGGVLGPCLGVEPQHGALARDEVGIADVAVRRFGDAHHAIAHLQRIGRHAEPFGGACQQPCARLRGRQAQRLRMDLDRRTRDGRALVGRARGIAEHHAHAGHAKVEFLRHDLRERGLDAGAQVDVPVERGSAAIVPHGEQHFVAFDGVAGDEGRLALGRRRRGRRLAQHQQHAVGGEEFGARLRQVGAARHGSCRAHMRAAARCTASRISMCVPQRHRLPDSSLRMRASLACGSRASSAAACITMPLRQ